MTDIVSLTESAREYMKTILTTDTPYLYLCVEGGGCAGFSYEWKVLSFTDYDAIRWENDEIVSLGNGQRLIVNGGSVFYLVGSEIDYVREIAGNRLVITNPQAKSSCGCGSSVGF